MKSREMAPAWVGMWVACAVLAGCGDSSGGPDGNGGPNHVSNPQPAAGGGVSSGAVNSELNVFVIDSRTKAAIADADVTVVRDPPLQGKTDAAGLHTFSDESLKGAQVIAVSAAGHVPATWYGANGAVVTIPLDPTSAAPAPETASVSGSMTLPRPTQLNHFTAALVLYSFTKNLDAAENKIQQPAPTNPDDPPRNACVVGPVPLPGTCTWSLLTRTGPQTHYAIIIDLDTKGTATGADDSFALLGYAARTGINLTKDQTVTNETLTMVNAADIATLNVTFPASAPTGLGTLNAIPVLELGDERMLFPVPVISPTTPSAKVPKATGVFAGGSWTLFAQARTSAAENDPQSTIFARDLDPTKTLALSEFQVLPTGLTASGGVYSFAPVADVSVHTAEILGADGKALWKATILDGTTTLGIDQTPDPLAEASGTLTFKVGAAQVENFNAADFSIDDVVESLSGLSSQILTFQK